jgi:hypothetical protein
MYVLISSNIFFSFSTVIWYYISIEIHMKILHKEHENITHDIKAKQKGL